MTPNATDWLDKIDGSALDEEKARAFHEENARKHVEFARLYNIFVDDPRGRAILAQWDSEFRRTRIAVNATLQEYAAYCASRDFVERIYAQLDIAKRGLQV